MYVEKTTKGGVVEGLNRFSDVNSSTVNNITKHVNKLKGIKIRCVPIISLIADKRLDTTTPSMLSINDRQAEANWDI